jgi:hypothetical protein
MAALQTSRNAHLRGGQASDGTMKLYRKFVSTKTGAASKFCHPADQSKM